MPASIAGDRPEPLQRFYSALSDLNRVLDGPHFLSEYQDLSFPNRGIYVFFSPGTDLESAPPSRWQISRIGTVGVSEGSSNPLRSRLRQHRGNAQGEFASGGNHRGSIMRLHIGRSIIDHEGLEETYPDWGLPTRKLDDTRAVREIEHPLEKRVSDYIRDLPFLWVDIPGEPGSRCDRAKIERNLIALVSQIRRQSAGGVDADWLGYYSPRPEINQTGLWNIEHVNELYNPAIVDSFEEYIGEME